MHTDALIHAYNTQVNRVTVLPPFELVLCRSPKPLAIDPITEEKTDQPVKPYHYSWKSWLKHLTQEAITRLKKAQKLYQRNLINRILLSRQEVLTGSFVLVRKEHFNGHEKKQKLSVVSDGAYEVMEAKNITAVLKMYGNHY